MTTQFLVTVETPGDVPADRLAIIRGEIEMHAAASVQFNSPGQQKPDKVKAHLVKPVRFATEGA